MQRLVNSLMEAYSILTMVIGDVCLLKGIYRVMQNKNEMMLLSVNYTRCFTVGSATSLVALEYG